MKNMRKKSIALVAGLAITGIVGASAASLGITSEGLGAGVEPVASCDDEVTVAYTTGYVAGLAGTGGSGFVAVNTVTIGDVDAACDGLAYAVTLLDAGDAAIGNTYEGTAATGSFDITVDPADTVDAEDVEGIAIVIGGTP